MLDLTLALELRDAGLTWHPEPGDRFMVTNVEMLDDLFHLADMVIEARKLDTGTIFAFNGTTEWALDSVDQTKTVWFPAEGQLRVLLGGAFAALERRDGEFVVSLDDGRQFRDRDPENAYGRALLDQLKAS